MAAHDDAEDWELDLGGCSVEMVTIDQRVTLHLHGESHYDGSVILESGFRVRAASGDILACHPEKKATLVPILECFGKVVDSVSVTRADGLLTLTFTDGVRIEAESDAQYEAWEVNAPGLKLIAMPGGGEPASFA